MYEENVVVDAELESESQMSDGGLDDKKTEDYDQQSPKSEKQKKEESEENYADEQNENKKLGLDWGLVFTFF
jgi:hypothetical protein